MARIKKYSPEQNLSSFQTFIVDDTPNSEYFRITEFKDTFTGGKNGFLIEGSEYLKESTEIKIELLDVNGDPIYYEPGNGIPEYYEGISKLIAVYIYNDTPIGLGKITILGELKEYDDNGVKREVPAEWKGAYNVKWERTFQINKSLPNEDKVRFYRRPAVTIDEIVKPIFSGNPPVVTQTGTLDGIPLVPTQGGNLSNFTLPTSYRLKVNSGNNWTGSIEGEVISFDNINYSPTINEVVNETELIVSPPYSQNNIVQSFTNEDYSLEFPYIEGVGDLATALTGSFAKISITDMKTFVGDAARVKVFRRSQSNLTDFEFVQEIQLESNEVLRDITTFAKKEEPYGFFSQPVINDYWVTSSNDFNVSFNQNYLYNSAKLDSSPNNFFFTSQSFSIQDGVEYTLDFNVRVSGSIDNTDYLKVFLSGSNNGTGVSQTITTINSSNGVLQKTNINENIVADAFDSAKLYFEVSGSDWYINNVSLKASQETSFSPDEITFIQQVPKTLVEETFDYRFEFYDINNNFIPVRVEDTKTFVGGNTNLFNKSIEINADNLYFSFDSASNPANPLPPTVINFEVDTNIVTGSINYTSGAFDFFGNEISASEYIGGQYPGLLRNREEQNGRLPFLTVQDFTGSRDDLLVQFIRFTAEVEGVSDSIIITRVEDGKGGVSFEIVPYRGTQIKNKESKTLEVQAVRVDGINRIDLQSGLTRDFSEAKLHLLSASLDGLQETTTYVSLSQAITDTNFIQGVSAGLTGSGEIDYNAIFTRDAIDNELTLYLMDGPTSESILTSLILTDLKDGLNPGLVTSTTDQFNIKYKPRETSPFNPLESIVTASFQRRGTTLNPISASLKVIPSSSIEPKTELPQLFMFYETGAFDDTVGVVVTDYLGNTIDNGIPGVTLDETSGNPISFYQAVQTKQLNFEFTYTEPITSASVTANKSFFITPDGLPGQDSITIDIDPNPIALGSNHKGEVFNYALADTNIQISQGDYFLINTASGDPGTFTTRSVVPTNIVYGTLDGNSTTTMSLAGFETMSALSASVRYDFDIYPYFTASLITASRTQKFTKVVEGGGAIEVTLDPIAVSFNADESGYISDYSAGKTEVIIKQNDEFFFYDENDSGTPGTFVTASISASNISFSEVSTSFDDLTASGSVDSTGGEVLHFKGFSGMSRNDVSASILYNFKVYPYSLKGGVAGVPRIVSKKQTFSKVNDGSKARKVSLAASADTVIYDGDGTKVSPQGSITLTATAFNTSGSAYFKFIDDEGGTIQVSSTDNTVNTLSPLPGTGSVRTYTVELRDGNPSGDVADVDSVSISGVQEGSTPYIALLENPASSVTVEVDGTTYFDNAGTLIRAYKGGTELQYVEEYNENAFDPITFLPIGTFGQFSASVHEISSFLTQGTLRDGKEIVSKSISPTEDELFASASAVTNWNLPQDNTQGYIIYKIDFENGRGTQFLQQSFSTVFEGATGPGLVVRGEWDETIPYVFDLNQKRRDAVFKEINGDVHYWATTELTPTASEYVNGDGVYTLEPQYDDGPPATQEGDIDYTTTWQYLGQQDFFVAAKLAIFEESFVKNTINVGIPPAGNQNANIAIVGGTDEPYISVGQTGTQGFRQPGVFIGMTNDFGSSGTAGTTGILSLKSSPIGSPPNQTYNSMEWDGNTLTIRGAIRQTAAGEIEGSLRGTWTAGSIYYPNDIVSNEGQSWNMIGLAHTASVDSYEPGVGVDNAESWSLAAAAGSSGTSGDTAKTIRLSSTAQAFVKPKDSATLTPASITLTANKQNITTAGSFTSSPSVTLIGSGDSRVLTNTNFGSNTAVTITVTADGLSDEITIVKVEEGSDAITIVNTNQSHNVPAASDGTVTSGNLAGSGTTIKVFEGATPLDFTTGTAGAGQFSISATQSPTSIVSTPSISGNGTDTATVADFTSMVSGTDSVVITYTLTVVKNDGTSVPVTTTQTLTKSKAGVDGVSTTGFRIEYSTSTTAADPGSGKFRFNASDPASATEVYISETDLQGLGVDPILDVLTTSTNTPNKSIITFRQIDNQAYYDSAYVTSQTDNGGWRTLDITHIDKSGWGNVGNGDAMFMAISVLGDKGVDGAAGEAAGIVYAGEWTEDLPDGSTPTAANKVAYLGEDDLKYVAKYETGGNTYWVTAITHRYAGAWSSGQEYILNDIVSYIGTYWRANSAVTGVGTTNPPNTNASWDSLGVASNLVPGTLQLGGVDAFDSFGAEFTSVATDILFAQDVYADKTVNIGSNDGSPVIALNADSDNLNENPFIAIGQDTFGFGEDGIYFGYDGGNPVLSMVTGSSFLVYESGSIRLSDASLRGTGSIIEGSEIRVGRNQLVSPTASNAYNFTVSTTGIVSASDAFIQGTIEADAGNIGDWVIDSNTRTLRDNDSEIIFDPNIPEIQMFSGSLKRLYLGNRGQLSEVAASGDTLSWASPEAEIPTANFNTNAAIFDTENEIVYTGVTDNTTPLSAGTYTVSGISWPQLTIDSSGLGTIAAGTQSTPNDPPEFAGQIHGGPFQKNNARAIQAYLYLELVDTTNGNAVLDSELLGFATAQGNFTVSTNQRYWQAVTVGGEGGFQSVVGDTEITLFDGTTKLAKDIKIGDVVLSWNSDTNLFEGITVSNIFNREVSVLYKITIGGNEILVSDSHGFWLGKNTKAYAKDLLVGDTLYVRVGDSIEMMNVDSVEIIESTEEVYTFTVPNTHNYVSNDIVSHNYALPGEDLEWQRSTFIPTERTAQNGTISAGSNVEKNFTINQASSAVGARFKLLMYADKGFSTSCNSSGQTFTTTYNTSVDYAQTSGTGVDVYFASGPIDSSVVVEKQNNYVEIQPGGINLVTSEDVYAQIRRRDSLTLTGGYEETALLSVISGSTILKAPGSNPDNQYGASIHSEGSIIPESADKWTLGQSGLKWHDVHTQAINGINAYDWGARTVGAICGFSGRNSNGSVSATSPKFNIASISRNDDGGGQYYRITFSDAPSNAIPFVMSHGRLGSTDSDDVANNEFTMNMGAKPVNTLAYVDVNFKDNDTNTDVDPVKAYVIMVGSAGIALTQET
jgi:hypothetical protein